MVCARRAQMWEYHQGHFMRNDRGQVNLEKVSKAGHKLSKLITDM
jgi:hypothetical protein